MSMRFKHYAFVFMFSVITVNMSAQDVLDYLSKYTEENGKKYMQPFANSLSADFNSGLFHQAKIKKWGFQLYLGLESQMAFIPDNQKYFTATTEGSGFPETTVNNAPTIFGPTEGTVVEDPGSGMQYVFPGGFDLDYLPLAIPQLTVGSVWGTDLTIRYFQTSKIEDLGDLKMFGWGVRHSIDQHIKMPLNLVVAYYHQRLEVGEYLDFESSLMQLQTSYSIPVVTFYGGIGYEKGNVDLRYDYTDQFTNETLSLNYDLTSENSVRFTIGLGLNLGPFNLHGDYNIAKTNTLAFGIGLGFGEK